MARRRKSTFGQRLLESAREVARIERGEIEPARVTRYTVAEAVVEPPPRYGAGRIRCSWISSASVRVGIGRTLGQPDLWPRSSVQMTAGRPDQDPLMRCSSGSVGTRLRGEACGAVLHRMGARRGR